MDLALRPALAASYGSASQIARLVSEDWARRELYCPACTADQLSAFRAGYRVSDFHCVKCAGRFQVKAKRGPFGASVTNSAYEAKMEAIEGGTVPHYVFLRYEREPWRIHDGFIVPGHFMTRSVVAQRAPLAATARRAGWVGSTILLSKIPPDGRVAIVRGGVPVDRARVRTQWARFGFIQGRKPDERGWLGDVLRVIRELEALRFHLSDVYAHEEELRRLHPGNQHVTPKIRQQVQTLRDRGILRSLGGGNYEVVA